MVNWVEKVRLDCIRRLLEITKRECYHDLLLSMKNLQDLGTNPFPLYGDCFPSSLAQ